MNSLFNYIVERKVVNLPKEGQMVILAGGAGSGKGYATNKYILNNFKTFNVDDLKEQYVKWVKNHEEEEDSKREYNFKNAKDVGDLHIKVKNKNWENREKGKFFNIPAKIYDKVVKLQHEDDAKGIINELESLLDDNNIQKRDHLDNIIFDMTAKDDAAIAMAIFYGKTQGYDISVVWVVASQDVASSNNQKRSRSIDDKLLRKIHNSCKEFLPKLLGGEYPYLTKYIDNAYLIYSNGQGYKFKTDDYTKSPVDELKKVSDTQFNFDEYEDKVMKLIDGTNIVKESNMMNLVDFCEKRL